MSCGSTKFFEEPIVPHEIVNAEAQSSRAIAFATGSFGVWEFVNVANVVMLPYLMPIANAAESLELRA